MEPNPYEAPGNFPTQQTRLVSDRSAVVVGVCAGIAFLAVFFILLLFIVPPDPQLPIACAEIGCCSGPFSVLVALIFGSASRIYYRQGSQTGATAILLASSLFVTIILGWLLSWVMVEVMNG